MNRPTAHFLHIGKTGGTAVRHALAPVAQRGGIILHDHSFRLRDVPSGETAFFFLRNPVARFVSAFNSRLRQGRPRWHTIWNKEEAWAFGRYKTANDLAEDLGSDDASRAMSGISHVNSHYSVWLENPAYVLSRDILFIRRQERLTNDFSTLTSLLGVTGVQLPNDEVDRHATPIGFSRFISDKGRNNVMTWYAGDYQLIETLAPTPRE